MSGDRSFFANPYNYLAVSGIVPGAILGGLTMGPFGAVLGGIVGTVASGAGTMMGLTINKEGWSALRDPGFSITGWAGALAVLGFFAGGVGGIPMALFGATVFGLFGALTGMVGALAVVAGGAMFDFIKENTPEKPAAISTSVPQAKPALETAQPLTEAFTASNQNTAPSSSIAQTLATTPRL